MTTKEEAQKALDLWRQVEWSGNSFSVAVSLDAEFQAKLNDAIEKALTAQIEAPAENKVMEAVKNLRDLMKHGSANGAIEVWVQYDHPVKLAGLSHVDCETIIHAATKRGCECAALSEQEAVNHAIDNTFTKCGEEKLFIDNEVRRSFRVLENYGIASHRKKEGV